MKNIFCERDARGDGLSADRIIRMFSEEATNDVGAPMFKTRREFICFAAALGFSRDARRPLSGPTVLAVDGRICERGEESLDLLYTVSIGSSRDLQCLEPAKEEEVAKVFEEFINGGIDIIRDWIVTNPSDTYGDRVMLDGLADFIAQANDPADNDSVEF